MKFLVLAAAMTAAISWSVAAQPASDDPASPAPRVQYRSVFQDTPTGVEQENTEWKKANAEVGQFRRGHADLVQWEAKQQGQPVPRPQPPASQRKPQER